MQTRTPIFLIFEYKPEPEPKTKQNKEYAGIVAIIFTFTVMSTVIALSIYTAWNIAYGYLPLDGVSGDKVFNESGYILQYCREHASDSLNPVQDLLDKGIITWGWFDGETCMTVKQAHDALLRNEIEKMK